MTRDQLLAFVNELDPELQRVFWMCHNLEISTRDTLEPSYQVVSSLLEVFTQQATFYRGNEVSPPAPIIYPKAPEIPYG